MISSKAKSGILWTAMRNNYLYPELTAHESFIICSLKNKLIFKLQNVFELVFIIIYIYIQIEDKGDLIQRRVFRATHKNLVAK